MAKLLSSQGRAEIFRLLFGPTDGELHLREMERRAGLSEATLRQELKRLGRLGADRARGESARPVARRVRAVRAGA